jgi:hypothetical protein
MSRSGYSDDGDCDNWQHIMYRGAVTSALYGKRGQAFLRELLAALDNLPSPELVAGVLEERPDGAVCSFGAVGKARGLDMTALDNQWKNLSDDYAEYDFAPCVAKTFGVAKAFARELMWVNDQDSYYYKPETPSDRFKRVRAWVVSQLKDFRDATTSVP